MISVLRVLPYWLGKIAALCAHVSEVLVDLTPDESWILRPFIGLACTMGNKKEFLGLSGN